MKKRYSKPRIESKERFENVVLRCVFVTTGEACAAANLLYA